MGGFTSMQVHAMFGKHGRWVDVEAQQAGLVPRHIASTRLKGGGVVRT